MEARTDMTPPLTLPLAEVIPWVQERVAALLRAKPSVVVGVTGPVGSGKTTLAGKIAALYGERGLVLSTDHYLPDYERIEYLERDDPRHADLPLLAQHLSDLRAGRGADVPVWSFQSHEREGVARMASVPLIVCEGIHALHARVRPELDVAVFVRASAATRWARWKAIEERGERGWGVDVAHAFFRDVAEPTYGRFAPEYMRHAHVIAENEG